MIRCRYFPPACTCRTFKSLMIPCRGICAVFGARRDADGLHPTSKLLRQKNLHVPSLKKQRYGQLLGLATEPCSFSAERGGHVFKFASVGLAKLINQVKDPATLDASLMGGEEHLNATI